MVRLQAIFVTSGLSSHLKRASQHLTAEKLHRSFFMTGSCHERENLWVHSMRRVSSEVLRLVAFAIVAQKQLLGRNVAALS